MNKSIVFKDASSKLLCFDVYFRCDYKNYIDDDFVEYKELETKNMFEKVYKSGLTYIGVFYENPLGFRTFIKTTDDKLMQYISTHKFIFFNPDDNFDDIHVFEILSKTDFYELDGINKKVIKDSEYEKFFKIEDGRMLIQFDDQTGQLFDNEKEFNLYLAMINSY